MSDFELAVVSVDSFAAPAIIARAGPSTRKKFFEFITVPIRNANTRAAYYRAIQQFLAWLSAPDIRTSKTLSRSRWPPTSKPYSARPRLPRSNSTWPFVRLRTKGGKEKEFPVHHLLEDILDAYLDSSGLRTNPAGPLFPTTRGNSRELGSRPMTRIDAARMLKRLLAQAGIVGSYSPHSFRATGLTRFLEEGGTLEGAQNIADHADSRTTNFTTADNR